MFYGPGIGVFVFSKTEIPGNLPFGGPQLVKVHNLIGGGRDIQALGAVDRPLEWKGWFLGANAMSRAKKLNQARLAGLPVWLRWSNLTYKVIIDDFEPDYRFETNIPYRIRCIPVTATWANPPSPTLSASRLSTLQRLLAEAQTCGAAISSTFGNIVSGIQTLTSGVSDIATAANSVVSSIKNGLLSLQQSVDQLRGSVENSLINITTLGGVFPNNPAASAVESISNQINLATQQYQVENLSSLTLGASNVLNALGPVLVPLVTPEIPAAIEPTSSTKQLVATNTDLSTVAARAYGDPTLWPLIANANGLIGPIVPETLELVIPPWQSFLYGESMPGFTPAATGTAGGGIYVGPFITPELNVLGVISEGSGLTAQTGASALPVMVGVP